MKIKSILLANTKRLYQTNKKNIYIDILDLKENSSLNSYIIEVRNEINSLKNKNKLNFSDINIFSGQNGTGKTTILDSIFCLSDISKIHVLLTGFNPTYLNFEIDNQNNIEHIEIIANKYGKENSSSYPNIGCIYINHEKRQEKVLDLNKEKLEEIYCYYKKINKIPHENADYIDIQDFFSEKLYSNKTGAEKYFHTEIRTSSNIQATPIQNFSDGLSTSSIKVEELASGWKAFIRLFYQLEYISEKESIIILDEPEIHLHPRLQKYLIEKIIEIQSKMNLQFFIATHSTTFMNLINWENYIGNIKLFQTNSHEIIEFTESSTFLHEMGIVGSDIFQTNCTIWVEGPSDRIYINYWLSLLTELDEKYSQKFKENVHYSFILYGGSLMKHYSESSEDTIWVEKINRQSYFIYDKDNGDMNGYKKTIHTSKIEKLITDYYTIEGFLPDDFFRNYFEFENIDGDLTNQPIKKIKTNSKYDISLFYVKKCYAFEEHRDSNKLINFVRNIYNFIKKNNSI